MISGRLNEVNLKEVFSRFSSSIDTIFDPDVGTTRNPLSQVSYSVYYIAISHGPNAVKTAATDLTDSHRSKHKNVYIDAGKSSGIMASQ